MTDPGGFGRADQQTAVARDDGATWARFYTSAVAEGMPRWLAAVMTYERSRQATAMVVARTYAEADM